MLKYKGYSAMIEYSPETKSFYGKLKDIKDLITFVSESSKEIENDFHRTVDEYIEERENI